MGSGASKIVADPSLAANPQEKNKEENNNNNNTNNGGDKKD